MRYRTNFELMLTLECHWGCNDCCRAVDKYFPKDSHVTIDQAKRFIQQLKDDEVAIDRLKINGGDPVHNPDFEELIWLFHAEVPNLFKGILVQTAYPYKVIQPKYHLPENVRLRSDPVTRKHFKRRHVPPFISPFEMGILGENDPPPLGSSATKRICEQQKRCGRSFERWGFTACAQEAVIGRLIGIAPYSATYKHWGDPEICKHCPISLGKQKDRELKRKAYLGEISRVSKIFDFDNLKEVYDKMPETQKPW